MPDWHFVIADTNGNTSGEIWTATPRQLTWSLTDASTASWTMDGAEADANYVQETTTDLIAYRGNQPQFRGRITASQDTLGEVASNSPGGTSPDTHSVDFSATDYRGMLAFRLVPDPPTPAKGATVPKPKLMDQSTIAWDYIDASQNLPGGNWGIMRGRYAASVQRTITEPAGTPLDQAIDNIANLNGGFEWDIGPTMHFNTWVVPPHGSVGTGAGPWMQGRGQNIGTKLTYGDNVTNVQRGLNVSTSAPYANVVRYSGSFTQAKSMQVDVNTEAIYTLPGNGGFGPRGRWELQVSNNNLTTVEQVLNAARYELVRDANLTPTYLLTLKQGWWSPDQLWLGDLVTVTVNHGRLNDSYQARVTQMDVFLGDVSSEETVQVTVGPSYSSMLRRILRHERLITQIQKTAN